MHIPEGSEKVNLLTGSLGQVVLSCGPPESLNTRGGAHVIQYTLANQTLRQTCHSKRRKVLLGARKKLVDLVAKPPRVVWHAML